MLQSFSVRSPPHSGAGGLKSPLISEEVFYTGFWSLRGWGFMFRKLCGTKEGWEMHERYLGSGETRWVDVLCVIITLLVQFLWVK